MPVIKLIYGSHSQNAAHLYSDVRANTIMSTREKRLLQKGVKCSEALERACQKKSAFACSSWAQVTLVCLSGCMQSNYFLRKSGMSDFCTIVSIMQAGVANRLVTDGPRWR